MPLLRVDPDRTDQVTVTTDLLNAAHEVDDPTASPELPADLAGYLRHGWDLEPRPYFLYGPDLRAEDTGEVLAERAVGLLGGVEVPERDNTHLIGAELVVHPRARRRGHGSALMRELLGLAREHGRSVVWVYAVESDLGSRAFAEGFGFRFASHDARRRQVLPEVDWAEVDRLGEAAAQAAAGYRLERRVAPVPDEVLAELVEVTAAINDAPLGDLTYGDEHFDLARLRDLETACARRGGQLFRVVARDRDTGRAAGHTVVVTNRWHPEHAVQADTAVAREHRGHRLGQLVKIDMMRWLAEVAPQVQMLETWNQADNAYMIQVNEAIGYRLAEVYATYERRLEP